jgi:hypothetical protein
MSAMKEKEIMIGVEKSVCLGLLKICLPLTAVRDIQKLHIKQTSADISSPCSARSRNSASRRKDFQMLQPAGTHSCWEVCFIEFRHEGDASYLDRVFCTIARMHSQGKVVSQSALLYRASVPI